jgi:hypothetical protein
MQVCIIKAEDVIKRIMEECDGMMVSTAKLKEVYSPYCKKLSVIPNHLPKFVWGEVIQNMIIIKRVIRLRFYGVEVRIILL